jgi:hypothetical protein
LQCADIGHPQHLQLGHPRPQQRLECIAEQWVIVGNADLGGHGFTSMGREARSRSAVSSLFIVGFSAPIKKPAAAHRLWSKLWPDLTKV